MRRSIRRTLLVLAGFVVGFVCALLCRERAERYALADRVGTDLGALSSISQRLAADDANGAMEITRREIAWRSDLLHGLFQQHPASLDSIMPTVQLARQRLEYQGSRALCWAPASPADDARHAFEQQVLVPRQTAPKLSPACWLGEPRLLSELRGRVVLLDFWGTSCAPCVAGMPKLRQLQDEFRGRGLVVLTIHGTAPRDQVERFIQRNPLGLPVAIDDEEGHIFQAYGVHALPTKVLIDRDGRVVWSPDPAAPRQMAAPAEEAELELRKQIEAALADQNSVRAKRDAVE